MIRAAIYARFSSDRQNDRSVDDQIASARELCAREGFAVIHVFSDSEISGASTLNRPGYLAMMRAVENRRFDVIIAEDLDRLFRDSADYHAARKRLDFLGLSIHTFSGQVGKIDGALRALMGELFLENLAVHTRRGLEAVVRSGRHAGGRAYGYRTVPGKPGELTIDETEAEIIRRIFREFIEGKTPRAIAVGLNASGIRPPRGRHWNASTINGCKSRAHGIGAWDGRADSHPSCCRADASARWPVSGLLAGRAWAGLAGCDVEEHPSPQAAPAQGNRICAEPARPPPIFTR